MLTVLLLIGLVQPVQDTVRSEAAYEAVLRAVRGERPGSTLYLANLPVRRFRTAKDTRATAGGLLHRPEWVRRMEEGGLLAGSCTPPERVVGCRGVVPMTGPEPTTVQFWPLDGTGGDAAEVFVTLAHPLSGGVPFVEKWSYLLERGPDGAWRVASRDRVGVT